MRSSDLPSDGQERYTTERVTFEHPFSLGKPPVIYPAGAYQVETRTQQVEAGGHTAHIRTATVLVVATATGSYCREVNGSDLDGALLRDKDEGRSASPSENPDRGNASGSK